MNKVGQYWTQQIGVVNMRENVKEKFEGFLILAAFVTGVLSGGWAVLASWFFLQEFGSEVLQCTLLQK